MFRCVEPLTYTFDIYHSGMQVYRFNENVSYVTDLFRKWEPIIQSHETWTEDEIEKPIFRGVKVKKSEIILKFEKSHP